MVVKEEKEEVTQQRDSLRQMQEDLEAEVEMLRRDVHSAQLLAEEMSAKVWHFTLPLSFTPTPFRTAPPAGTRPRHLSFM